MGDVVHYFTLIPQYKFMSPVEEIKARLDIIDIVSENVQLKKSGRHYMGYCPFHNNTRSPAFAVFPESGTWKCFGACADGGDIFSYVMKKNGWDFKESLVQLAKRANVTLEEMTPQQKQRKSIEDEQVELLESAADYFHQLFLHAPQAEFARNYVKGREFTDETIATFKFGFALNAWDALRTHFLDQGYSEQDLLDAGLLTENVDKGTKYDRFRNRIIIPIRDITGRTVGFGARTLEKDGIPKYLNSPQTGLFDKSTILFGLDMGKRFVREARQAVIVEGYMDVIMAWQGGFRNVVAQMGTSLTREQLQLLKRYTKRFVIALDADVAGANATMRSLKIARDTLDREAEIGFDPTGLIKEESRLQADIRIATMPEGEDPDSIIRNDPANWAKLIGAAQPVVEYVTSVLVSQNPLSDAKNKSDIAQQVIPLILDITDPIERDHYWQYLGRILQVDERSLRQLNIKKNRQNGASNNRQRPVVAGKSTRPLNEQPDSPPHSGERASALRDFSRRTTRREEEFLGRCVHSPILIRQVNKILSEIGQPILHAQDFSVQIDRELFLIINNKQSAGEVVTASGMWDSLEPILVERLKFISTEAVVSDKKPGRSLALSVLQWRWEKKKQLHRDLKLMITSAHHNSEQESLSELTLQVNNLNEEIREIDQAKTGISSRGNRRYSHKW
ncbi:MAG: DNA primase [Cellvibrionaceae bacterium]|jgi:DNA primase